MTLHLEVFQKYLLKEGILIFSNVTSMKRKFNWMEVFIAHSSGFPETGHIPCFVVF